jgi:GntR family transcriptional regulator
MSTVRGSGLPAYQRIAATYRNKIASGELVPGDQLPTEHEIADEFGVVRQTVRGGLAVLINEGLIVAQRPHGHFVRQRGYMTYRPQAESHPPPETPEMERVCQQNAGEEHHPSESVEVSLVEATAEIAPRLEILRGEVVVARRHVRFVNGEPVNTSDWYFPLKIVKDSEIMAPAGISRSVNEILADLGYPQVRAIDEILTRSATPDEAYRLELGAGNTQVMVHRATGYTAYGRPVRCMVNLLPADRYTIVCERTWPGLA